MQRTSESSAAARAKQKASLITVADMWAATDAARGRRRRGCHPTRCTCVDGGEDCGAERQQSLQRCRTCLIGENVRACALRRGRGGGGATTARPAAR